MEATKPKLKLVGKDGNAFAILAAGMDALRKAGRHSETSEYYKEATSGDYNHLLQVTMKWFDVR